MSLYSQAQSCWNYKNTATSKTELISFLVHKDAEILDLHLYLTTKWKTKELNWRVSLEGCDSFLTFRHRFVLIIYLSNFLVLLEVNFRWIHLKEQNGVILIPHSSLKAYSLLYFLYISQIYLLSCLVRFSVTFNFEFEVPHQKLPQKLILM